jgi:protein-S-isoprenylcysteine O-methyltransferase Ste14
MARLIDFRPPRIAMGLALVAFAAHGLLRIPAHEALMLPAAMLGGVGFAVMIRAWWLFRVAGTAVCPTAESSILITHDIYALTRNPMYLGIMLMLVALGLAFGGLSLYLAPVAFFFVMDRVFCPFEEQKSLCEFGAEYADYRERTRRWL